MACHLDGALHADARPLLVATVPGWRAASRRCGRRSTRCPAASTCAASGERRLDAPRAPRRSGRRRRRKMTTPDDPDFAYFSQFLSTPRDGSTAPAAEDTDFRSFEELMRRQIKPAWYHFYNLTKVLCEVHARDAQPAAARRRPPPAPPPWPASASSTPSRRRTPAPRPTERDAYGIDDVLQARRRPPRARAPGSAAPARPRPRPTHAHAVSAQSLDVASSSPRAAASESNGPAGIAACRRRTRRLSVRVRRRRRRRHEARGGVRRAPPAKWWPGARGRLMRELVQYDRRRRRDAPPRTFVTAANQPLHNGTHLRRLLAFLNGGRRRAAPGRRRRASRVARHPRPRRAEERAAAGELVRSRLPRRRRGVAAVVPAGALQGAAGERRRAALRRVLRDARRA